MSSKKKMEDRFYDDVIKRLHIIPEMTYPENRKETVEYLIKSINDNSRLHRHGIEIVTEYYLNGVSMTALSKRLGLTSMRIAQIRDRVVRMIFKHPHNVQVFTEGLTSTNKNIPKLNLESNISDLYLSVRLSNGLRRYILLDYSLEDTTIKDLTEIHVADLYKARNIGKKSCYELISKLQKNGFDIKVETDLDKEIYNEIMN